jgi:hypothetical protein
MCEDFASSFGYRNTGCCITITHRLKLPFSSGNFFTKNQQHCRASHTLFFSVSPMEDKTERPLFWYKWSGRGRITGGADICIEHYLQDAFKKMAEALGTIHTQYIHTSRVMVVVMVGSRPKVNYWPHGSTSPENYRWQFVASPISLHTEKP